MERSWKHRLSNVDAANKTANCSNCGPVKVGKSRTSKAGQIFYRCRKALNETSRVGKFRVKYGLDVRETADKSNCEICGGNVRIAYDHCHKSGKFRGWLCMKCNTALGLVNDDTEILKKMIAYLKK